MDFKRRVVLNIIGLFFLTIGIASIANTVFQDTKYDAGLAPVLWLCYIGVILIGIGALRKDSYLIASQLNILIIPLIFWNIDFFHALFNNFNTLFGIVDYYFVPGPLIGKVVSSQHLFTIPLSIIAIYLIKLKRTDAWRVSFFQLIIVFAASRLVTDYEQNVNCVFRPCANFIPSDFYIITWFVLGFLLVYITNLILIRLKFLRKNQDNSA